MKPIESSQTRDSVMRPLDAQGSFPNRVIKGMGLITTFEHNRKMRKQHNDLVEKFQKDISDFKKQMMDLPEFYSEQIATDLQDQVDELIRYNKKADEKVQRLGRDNKTLKKTEETLHEQIKKLKRKKPLGTHSPEIKALQEKNGELEEKVSKLQKKLKKKEPRKGIYLAKSGGKSLLDDKETSELVSEGYRWTFAYDLEGKNRQWYVLTESEEGVPHAMLRWMIHEELSKHTDTAKTSGTVNADNEFVSKDGKRVAIEVLTEWWASHKKDLREKIQRYRKDYDEVVIVTTHRDLVKTFQNMDLGVEVLKRMDVPPFIERWFPKK